MLGMVVSANNHKDVIIIKSLNYTHANNPISNKKLAKVITDPI